MKTLNMSDKLNPMQSEWIALHDRHYDLLSKNAIAATPLPDNAIKRIYIDSLKNYFNDYPDQITDYYLKMIMED